MKKDVIAGLGEIGSPILKLLSKKQITIGYDLDKRLVNETKLKKLQNTQTLWETDVLYASSVS